MYLKIKFNPVARKYFWTPENHIDSKEVHSFHSIWYTDDDIKLNSLYFDDGKLEIETLTLTKFVDVIEQKFYDHDS